MKTPLYDRHLRLNAKIVDFSGWLMPLQYKGILHEHLAVRTHAGMFDVSHMGRVLIEGPQAEEFLEFLSTNQISEKKDGSATYTVWANAEGGCVDDLIVYRKDANRFFVVVNASNREKDLQHMLTYGQKYDVVITPKYESEGILAIQGPKATAVVAEHFPEVKDLKPMRFVRLDSDAGEIILSATGYTGAGGCEIYAPASVIKNLWDKFLDTGAKFGLEPVGLGARDTLRLEMGYALYGHELTEDISPLESVSAWTVKLNKSDFLGKEAIQKNGRLRVEKGIVLHDKGIARQGYPVMKEGEKIGIVTSGTHSPTLKKAIAIILVDRPLSEGDLVEVGIRERNCKAEVVTLPFIQ